MTLVATTNVEADDAGLASGIFNTSQQIGGALGLAILSTLATDRTANVAGRPRRSADGGQQQAALVEGFQLAFIVAAGADRGRRDPGRGPAATPRRRPDRVGRGRPMPYPFAT